MPISCRLRETDRDAWRHWIADSAGSCPGAIDRIRIFGLLTPAESASNSAAALCPTAVSEYRRQGSEVVRKNGAFLACCLLGALDATVFKVPGRRWRLRLPERPFL